MLTHKICIGLEITEVLCRPSLKCYCFVQLKWENTLPVSGGGFSGSISGCIYFLLITSVCMREIFVSILCFSKTVTKPR